MTEKTE